MNGSMKNGTKMYVFRSMKAFLMKLELIHGRVGTWNKKKSTPLQFGEHGEASVKLELSIM